MAIDIGMLEQKARGIVDALTKMPQSKLPEKITRDFSADFNEFRDHLIEARPAFEPLVPTVTIGTAYVDVLAYAQTAVRLISRESGIVDE